LSIILAFSAVSILAEVSKELKCLASYLKDKNDTYELLSSVDYVAAPVCEEVINNHIKNYFTELDINDQSNKFNKCTTDVIEYAKHMNNYILLKALEEYDVGWKFWQWRSRSNTIDFVSKKLKDDVKKIKDYCAAHTRYDTR
jgi:hypothetical protein